MAVILEKPYTPRQRADFIVDNNHRNNKDIVETDKALYALEPWEKVENDQVIEDREGYNERQQQEAKEARKQEILRKLDELDLKSIRAIRANDQEYIDKYEAQAEELRKQLKELSGE